MAPWKKLTLKEFRLSLKPWITKEILIKTKERDKLLKKIKNENDPEIKTILKENYKLIRNEITRDKQKSKKAHFAAYFEKNKLKSADVWKGIRQLVNIKPAKTSNIKLMDENNNNRVGGAGGVGGQAQG